ncbi:MAG: GMP synthase subunit A [Candidatus Micrarchaeota archaeon]
MFIPVIDVGGQYNHLIYRALVEEGVDSELVGMEITLADLEKKGADGLAMGGGPQRIGCEMEKLGNLPDVIKRAKFPLLGICVTHQLIARVFGGEAGPAKEPEYGVVEVRVDDEDEILKGLAPSFNALQTHNDEVTVMPKDFRALAHSRNCRVQAMRHAREPVFGVQFHPESSHTEKGALVFRNFIEICRK